MATTLVLIYFSRPQQTEFTTFQTNDPEIY